jgi:dipeptidyl-peptidase-4
MIRSLSAVAFLALACTAAGADELPIARVFAAPALNGPVPRGVQISADGAWVTYLKPDPADQTTFDLWARPVKGGTEKLLVEGSKVEPHDTVLSEVEKSRRERERTAGEHGVIDYKWDEVGSQILIPAGGNLYLGNARTGAVKQVGATEGSATDAKISPKGGYVTYVRDQNLHALEVKSGRDVAITTEGRDAISFGMAEFVAQEEMDRFTGYWTSPDDKRIAFARVDETPVDVLSLSEIGAEGTTVLSKRYPRAGRPNAVIELYVAPLTGGSRVKVDFGSNTDVYLARVDWAKDGQTLYVQRESRDQTTLELLAVDPATGAARVLITEHQTPWINLNSDLTALKSGDFIWGSERTGFHHLYLYKADGTLVHAITSGDWPVAQSAGNGLHPSAVAGVDEAKGLVYFIAS